MQSLVSERAIINDVFLSNLYDKKMGHALLVGVDEVLKWKEYFANNQRERLPYLRRGDYKDNYWYDVSRKVYGIDNFESHLQDLNAIVEHQWTLIYDVLSLAPGRISLCGGAVIDIISGKEPNDFDIFFHCGCVDEAKIILEQCLAYLSDMTNNAVFRRSQGTITLELFDYGITAQFITRVYETKDQVLLGFDLAASRCGWNPVDSFFTTICGGMALAMGAFPVDLTQRSLSHGHRLEKYLGKGFDIILPGMPERFNERPPQGHSAYGWHNKIRHCDPNIDLDLSDDTVPALMHFYDLNTPDGVIHPCWNVTIPESENKQFQFRTMKNQVSDYSYDEIYANWRLISNGRDHNVVFQAYDLDDMIDLPMDVIKDSIQAGAYFSRSPSTLLNPTLFSFEIFMGEQYEEFIHAFCVKRDHRKANRMWKDRRQYYLEQGIRIANSIKENQWIIINPGRQHFGKFNPVIANPREWYGPDYVPVEVGLSMSCFQALMDCRKNVEGFDRIPNEILKIICEYWFIAEVTDARARLFALNHQTQVIPRESQKKVWKQVNL
jgi:hypothetical protein